MIIIIDFGSQTTHLIGRRLRQLGVEYQFADPEGILPKIRRLKPTGLIFSGGPSSVCEKDAPTINKKIFKLGIPLLGICYGWQLMAKLLGGKVKSTAQEYGPQKIKYINNLFQLPKLAHQVFVSHGDTVTTLPPGFEVFGSTKGVVYATVIHKSKKLYGVQFHPEADHTQYGLQILNFFVQKVCREKINKLELNPAEIIEKIKKQVGNRKVVCAVSGGVDSTVAAFLIGKAIGKNLIPVYVESGLMRPGTKQRVKQIFSQLIKTNLVIARAQKKFMGALAGVIDPEIKRKTIGKLYVDIFQEVARKHQDASFLGQGTIYSDVIESQGSKKSSKIKSHHNVGGLPKSMKLKLLEPVREYYKDEVRQLGRKLGLPEDIVMQQPFPGPGFAIRVRGVVTKKRLNQVKIADQIVIEEIKKANLYEKVFQCFAVMTGAYSTAVKGDSRVFAEVVAVRAYQSKDVMISSWTDLPYEVLQKISSRIINQVPNVSRVVYDITTKSPATMEWE